MPVAYPHTTRFLSSDRGLGTSILACLALLLIAGWSCWAMRAHVIEYETSQSARLQVGPSSYPFQAARGGQIVASNLALGREVHAGDILVALDNRAEALSLAEETARLAALAPQAKALEAQERAEEFGGREEQDVLSLSTGQALAQFRQADTEARAAELVADRDEQLRAAGVLSAAEAERAKSDAEGKRAAAEALRSASLRLTPELRVRDRDREARLRQIAGEEAKISAERSHSEATIERLRFELDRCALRAPISGRIGEAGILRVGAHIVEGQQLAVILPPGTVQVVAEFQPAAAFGKIRPGQKASMRLDGFPWAQYGLLSATVTRVADEIRDGTVRVELALTASRSAKMPRIPVQHGLPGAVEIEVGQVTPAGLLLRSAGAATGAL